MSRITATASVLTGFVAVALFAREVKPASGPSISGKIILAGKETKYFLSVGCLGKSPEGKIEASGSGSSVTRGQGSGISASARPDKRDTQLTVAKTGVSFKHTNRSPGHYLISVQGVAGSLRSDGGDKAYFDARWVEVKEGAKELNVDLTVDPSLLGKVEVTVGKPAGKDREPELYFVPLDSAGKLPFDAFEYLQRYVGIEPEQGKATLRLREGKYRLAAGKARADVEVKRGETVKVELKP